MKDNIQLPVKIFKDSGGYEFVYLWKNNNKKIFYVHRLVAIAWIPNKDKKKYQVDHVNRVRNDNKVNNLRWVTAKENILNRCNVK